MSSRAMPQCMACGRYRSPLSAENTTGTTGPSCAAFPDGIPDQVWSNQVDHREPLPGDHGLQWVSLDDQPFPEWAFADAVLGRGTG